MTCFTVVTNAIYRKGHWCLMRIMHCFIGKIKTNVYMALNYVVYQNKLRITVAFNFCHIIK